MGRQQKTCTYPHCQEPEDMERNARLCTEHTLAWIRSPAFTAAAKDPEMVARAAFGLKKQMATLLAAHRRRWAKADAALVDGAHGGA